MSLPEDPAYYAECLIGHVSELDRPMAVRYFGEERVQEIEERGLPTEDDVSSGRLNYPLPVLPRDACIDCLVSDEEA